MEQVIIYKNDEGGVSIVRPTLEALNIYGIDAIAKKDVPAGKPYKLIDAADVPTDRTQRQYWTVNEVDLTDGVGSELNTFEEVTE